MADSLLENIGEGIKYFKKKKEGKEPTFKKLEDAAGIESTPPPPPKPSAPKPEKQSNLLGKSIKGSGKMSNEEMKRGFRRVGVKLNYHEDGCE